MGKKGKVRVLFKIGFLYHKMAFDPLISLFEGDEGYEVCLSCKEEKTKHLGLFLRSREQDILKQFQREGHTVTRDESGFDVVFAGDTVTNHDELGKTIICFVNHGSGIKTIMYRNLMRDQKTRYHIFVEGEYRERKLREKNCLGISKVYTLGMPKLDPLFRGKGFDRDGILHSFGLDTRKKTVLYAPTYKPASIFELSNWLIEGTKDLNLIVKLHPYSWAGRYAPHSHHRVFERAMRKQKHVALVPEGNYSILPFLSVADTLITEASSTMFEFLATGKTGIIYDLDPDALTHSDGTPILDEDNREFLRNAFVHFNRPEKMREAIENALAHDPGREAEKGKARQALFFKLDGKASIRVKEAVERLLDDDDSRNIPS
jgi:CDP-glycerol glycerophosphotransferase (TagB/SpsB family)